VFVPVIVGLAEAPSMADDRLALANGTLPRQKVQGNHPGVDVVFRLWQCDKENHGWCEGPPVTVLCQSFDLLAGPSPSDKVSFERKKNTALRRRAASQPQNTAGSIGFVTIAVRCAGQRIGRSSAT